MEWKRGADSCEWRVGNDWIVQHIPGEVDGEKYINLDLASSGSLGN